MQVSKRMPFLYNMIPNSSQVIVFEVNDLAREQLKDATVYQIELNHKLADTTVPGFREHDVLINTQETIHKLSLTTPISICIL